MANFVEESNILPVRILRRDRVSVPWGEFVCNTKDHERGDAFLFFRQHQALIEENGYYEGTTTSRDFIIGKYRYHISISGCEITLYNQGVHEIGKPVRFSMKEMRILFA